MNKPGDWAAGGELRLALAGLLERHFSGVRSIAGLTHRPSVYASSYPIEELSVRLDDGTSLELIFKDLSQAPTAKPAFIHDPEREMRVYESLLPLAGLETAICYGAVREPDHASVGLFLEKVAGIELFQLGGVPLWSKVAARMAEMHGAFATTAASLSQTLPLLRLDQDYFRRWPARALALHSGRSEDRVTLERLVDRCGPIAQALAQLPVTLIHGELYPSNVLLRDPPEAIRVCPVDWEMAAVGPGLIDLAAMVGGRWTDGERNTIALGYRDAALPEHRLGSAEDFFQALDCCRLHLALQWLGWSQDFSPPPQHRQDWQREAVDLAARLGL